MAASSSSHSVIIHPDGPLGCSFGVVDGALHVVSLAVGGWAKASRAVAVGDVLHSASGGSSLAALKKALTSKERPLELTFVRDEVTSTAAAAAASRTHILDVTFDHAGKLGLSLGVVDSELHVVKAARNAEAHPSEPIAAGDVLVGVGGAPATIAEIKTALMSGERPLRIALRREEVEVAEIEAKSAEEASPPPAAAAAAAAAATPPAPPAAAAAAAAVAPPPRRAISISIDLSGALGMRLGRVEGELQVVSLADDGWAKATRALEVGDALTLLNGAPSEKTKLKAALTSGDRPLRLGFARTVLSGGGASASASAGDEEGHTRLFEVVFSTPGKLGMSFGVVDSELHVVKAARNAEAHPSEPIAAGDVLVGVAGAPATIAEIKAALMSNERPLRLAMRRVALAASPFAASSDALAAAGGGGGLSPIERMALAGAAASASATLPLASLTKGQVIAYAHHHDLDSLLGALGAHKVDGAMLNDVEDLDDLADFDGVRLHKKKLLRILAQARVNGVPSAEVAV